MVTGATLTVSDNIFAPEIVKFIQGGEFVQDELGNFVSFSAPVAGEEVKPTKFDFNIYTAQRDVAGDVVSYMKVSFAGCTGKPVNIKLENGAFFAPEYTIVSAPAQNESVYVITAVDELPTLTIDEEAGE